MADFFNVVFAGQIAPGSDPAAVKANIARLFKASDAMIEKLFSGQRIAVKKAVDQATAMKYRAVMKQAGAIAIIEEADAQGNALKPAAVTPAAVPVAPAPAPAKPVASAPPPQPVPVAAAKPQTMAERIAALAAEQASKPAKPVAASAPPPADEANAGTWKLYPTGAQLGVARAVPETVLPDISGMTMAKAGAELLSSAERAEIAPPPVPVPDVSAIKLAPAGGDLVKAEEREEKIPVAVDISALSMAAANTEVLKPEEKRVIVPVVVDTSALSLAQAGVDLGQIREEKKAVSPDIGHLKLANS